MEIEKQEVQQDTGIQDGLTCSSEQKQEYQKVDDKKQEDESLQEQHKNLVQEHQNENIGKQELINDEEQENQLTEEQVKILIQQQQDQSKQQNQMEKAQDDEILNQIKKQEIKLENTSVRKRQQTCMVTDLPKDEMPSFLKDLKITKQQKLLSLLNKDKEDDSLNRYKKALLGDVDFNQLQTQDHCEVEITKIEIVCPERPDGNIILYFDDNNFDKKNECYKLKEGNIQHIRVHFKVRNDIVVGLKFVNIVWRSFIQVDKNEQFMGAFAPLKEEQYFDLGLEQTPAGFLYRGTYTGKAMFIDASGVVHMKYEYKFKISSNW